MALVTKITVRLMRLPEKVKTILVVYNAAADAAATVAEITACAITPAALEMLDGEMLRMVEVATHAGYPMDAEAVLLIELEGLTEAVEEQTERIRAVCVRCGAREFRVAASAAERELLWKGRKNAFGAVGRVSSSYYARPRCCSLPKRPNGTISASAIFFTRAMEICIPSFFSTRVSRRNSSGRGRRARTSCGGAFRWAGRSRANTESAWRKTS
jgi:FAD/FMN-containing dehydrogenase